ncbi:synaptonemal complex protein 1-like [Bombus affinis]|uniref:synaptonemal complex protein 1-like n=1 Tax=Bombus affinis TaxID=309941 RepID=UPI0021B7BB21|nr:synaptonemal complex protein 1-like [Bombus affinis]
MEKIGAKGSNSYVAKRSKQVVRCQMEKSCDHSDIKNTLAIKLSEMKALHETILDDQNRLTQENVKLTEELNKLKEENTQAIAMKDKDIEELRKQIVKHCEKLERDVDQVELLVKRNKELESKNREILERDNELNKQLSELQERLATKEKIIRMKTILVQTKQKDVTILKEKTEQLLHIYENSMKDKLRNISDMCTEICNQSTSSSTLDNGEEEETSV